MRIFCAFKSYWTFFLSSSLQSTTLLILCYTVGNNLRLKPPIDHDVLHVHIHRLDVNTHAFFPIVIIFSVENRSSIIRPLGLLASHMDQLFRQLAVKRDQALIPLVGLYGQVVTKLEGGVNSSFEKLFGDLVKNDFNKLTI